VKLKSAVTTQKNNHVEMTGPLFVNISLKCQAWCHILWLSNHLSHFVLQVVRINDYKKECFFFIMHVKFMLQVVPRYLKHVARGFPNQRTQMQQSDAMWVTSTLLDVTILLVRTHVRIKIYREKCSFSSMFCSLPLMLVARFVVFFNIETFTSIQLSQRDKCSIPQEQKSGWLH